jgi:TetR/AcrR family transcriptional regulator, transcriptional repressor for nem operon
MARKIIEENYINRRKEILDAAQGLILTKGYNQMSIQDILDQLGISKGAFYHYFDSKHAVLHAMVERMMDQAKGTLIPILDNQDVTAVKKLEQYFSAVSNWKLSQKRYLMSLLQVWYNDDNLPVREKQTTIGREVLTPLLSKIIKQGIEEGIIHTSYPEIVSQVVIGLIIDLGNAFGKSLLSLGSNPDKSFRERCFQEMKNTNEVFTDAIERVLGISPGTLVLLNDEDLKRWVLP